MVGAIRRKPNSTPSILPEHRISIPFTREHSILSGLRDATGNPDYETDIIWLQALDHYSRGREYERILRDPESDEQNKSFAREQIRNRESVYEAISPKSSLDRKQQAISNLLNFLKYIAVITAAAILGNGLSLMKW